MRITNNLLVGRYMNNYYSSADRMQTTQIQMSSGKRVNKISDDPVALVTILSSRSKIMELEQYDKNSNYARAYIRTAESAVYEASVVMQNVYEKTVQLPNGTLTDVDRAALKTELIELRDHVVSILNTTFGEKNLFGGHNLNVVPFELDDNGALLYNGEYVEGLSEDDDLMFQNARIEITRNVWADVSVSGLKLSGVGDNNIINVFQKLITAIDDGDLESMQEAITNFQNKQTELLDITTQIGGLNVRLDYLIDRFSSDTIAYTDIQSRLEDVDEAQAIMNFKMAEAAYRAALGSGSFVLQQSLLDFLR